MEQFPFRLVIGNSVRRILLDPHIDPRTRIIPAEYVPGKKIIRAHVSLSGKELLRVVTAIILKRLHPSSHPMWCMENAEILLASLHKEDVHWGIEYLKRITSPLRLI